MARAQITSAANFLLVDDDGRILLGIRKGGWREGDYSVFGGHVEEGESIAEAAVREAEEELDIVIERDDLEFAVAAYRKYPEAQRMDYFFVTERWEGEPKIVEPHKCSGLDWFAPDELPENIVPYVRDSIQAWQRGERYLELTYDDPNT